MPFTGGAFPHSSYDSSSLSCLNSPDIIYGNLWAIILNTCRGDGELIRWVFFRSQPDNSQFPGLYHPACHNLSSALLEQSDKITSREREPCPKVELEIKSDFLYRYMTDLKRILLQSIIKVKKRSWMENGVRTIFKCSWRVVLEKHLDDLEAQVLKDLISY